MRNTMSMVRSRSQGMTLVELMVVIAIILIIAALIIPRYLNVTDRANKAKCNGNIATMNSAASVYIAKHFDPAPDLSALVADDLLQQIPECPFGEEYVFDGFCIANWEDHIHAD